MTHDDPAAPPARKPRRANADYRWTVPKVTAFLEALALCGRVAEAARSVGMGRQSAYKLRARLARTRFAAAFEGARKKGLRARAEASRDRMRSQWDGPLIGAHLSALQGDTGRSQGDARARQGDTSRPQGDRFARKATEVVHDTVTSVTSPTPAGGRRVPSRRAAHGLSADPAGVVSTPPLAKGDL